MDQAAYKSSTLAKGLMVLELLSKEGNIKGLSLGEVSEKLNLNQSTAYRYLNTLLECDWVEKDQSTFQYSLGRKSLQLSSAYLSKIDLRSIAHVHLQKLVEETNQTAHLGVLSEDKVLYLDKIESDSPIQMRSFLGMTAPLYSTAMGKAILATKSISFVQQITQNKLEKRTGNTITDINNLLTDLTRISELGYSIDNEENEEGISCFGAAIYGSDNKVLGAISISTVTQKLSDELNSLYGEKVRVAASAISYAMGCINDHWNLSISEYITK